MQDQTPVLEYGTKPPKSKAREILITVVGFILIMTVFTPVAWGAGCSFAMFYGTPGH
jgi:hypothetical protein